MNETVIVKLKWDITSYLKESQLVIDINANEYALALYY